MPWSILHVEAPEAEPGAHTAHDQETDRKSIVILEPARQRSDGFLMPQRGQRNSEVPRGDCIERSLHDQQDPDLTAPQGKGKVHCNVGQDRQRHGVLLGVHDRADEQNAAHCHGDGVAPDQRPTLTQPEEPGILDDPDSK